MNRHDLGFVVSRGLAVYFVLAAMPQFRYVVEVAVGTDSKEYLGHMLFALGTGGVYLALTYFLWFGAEKFGGALGPNRDIQGPSSIDLQRALLAVLGAWFMCTSIPGFLQYLLYVNIPDSERMMRMFDVEWVTPTAKLVLGFLLFFFNSPNVKSRAERAISIVDPNETQ